MIIRLEFDLESLDDCLKYNKYIESENMHKILFELMYNTKNKTRWVLQDKDENMKNLNWNDTLEIVFDEVTKLFKNNPVTLEI